MKRLFAIVLTVVLILTFSVSAFALKSPGGTVYYEVIINRTNTGSNSSVAEKVNVLEDGSLELTPVENDEIKFQGWAFYKKKMNAAIEGTDFEIVSVTFADGTPAVKGEDYTYKNGKVTSKNGDYLNVTIKPLSDSIYVSELYKGVDVVITPPGGKPVSPVTGVNFNMAAVAALFALVLLSGASAVVAAKRVRG